MQVYDLSRICREMEESKDPRAYFGLESSGVRYSMDPNGEAIENFVKIQLTSHGIIAYYETGDWWYGTPVMRYAPFKTKNSSLVVSNPHLLDAAYSSKVAGKITLNNTSFSQLTSSNIFLGTVLTTDHDNSARLPILYLACLGYNQANNSLINIIDHLRMVPMSEYAQIPSPFNTVLRDNSGITWMEKSCRMFVISSLSYAKVCLLVHCYHRGQFVEIINKDTTIEGLHRAHPGQSLLMPSSFRGKFPPIGVTLTKTPPNQTIYLLHKYYLQF